MIAWLADTLYPKAKNYCSIALNICDKVLRDLKLISFLSNNKFIMSFIYILYS